MKEQIAKAAQSPKTLGASIVLSAIGTGVGAVAMIWPTLRGEIPLTGWLIGLFLLNVAAGVFHVARERNA